MLESTARPDLVRSSGRFRRPNRGNPAGLLFLVLLALSRPEAAVAWQDVPGGKPGAPEADGRPREFAPGLYLDWHRRTVAVEGEIILRKGELELFACSPRTREHESIIVIRPRPMLVFQALGLMGFEPGSPVVFDPATDRWEPPKGQKLALRIRYVLDGLEYTVPLEHWLTDARTGGRPDDVPWVFAGSKSMANGRFGADVDGTVVALVDFETAIIAVGALHTADNERLWLAAYTEAIPPMGTPCTLLIRRGDDGARELRIDLFKDGTWSAEGRFLTTGELAKRAESLRLDGRDPLFVVQLTGTTEKQVVESALAALRTADHRNPAIELRPPRDVQRAEPGVVPSKD
jgi:hypothetical protein